VTHFPIVILNLFQDLSEILIGPLFTQYRPFTLRLGCLAQGSGWHL